MKVLWLLGEDLRFSDNDILENSKGHELAVAWFPSKSFLRAKKARRAFGLKALESFRVALRDRGLVLAGPRHLEWEFDELKNLIRDLGIDVVEVTRQWGSEELNFIEQLRALKMPVQVRDHNALLPLDPESPERLATEEVFTKWRKRVQSTVLSTSPSSPIRQATFPKGLNVPQNWVLPSFEVDTEWLHPRFGWDETSAQAALKTYFEGTAPAHYKETRNGLMNWGDSTKMSVYLAWGLLSPRAVLRALDDFENRQGANESTDHLRMELLWREYFRRILAKKGASVFRSQRGTQDLEKLEAWKLGVTKEDFVDAPMIEFSQTGWMSNRSRQVVASFLAKTWNVDWRLGAQVFEEGLIDYDVHSNWGNWAYVAGVGQDPRDRIFNPRLQAERYDPDGAYQRNWLSRREIKQQKD